MLNELLTHFIFAAATIALMMAFMQAFKGITEIKNCMLFLFLSVAALQLYQFFIIYQYFDRPGFISQQFFSIPKFIVGPALYIYFSRLFDRKYQFTPISLFHFFPALISLLHRIIFIRFYFPIDFGLVVTPETFKTVAITIDFSGLILLLLYLGITTRKIRILSVLGSTDRTISRLPIFILAYIALIIILYGSTVFIPSAKLVKITNTLTALGVIILFFLSQKYPELLDWFRREIKETSYKNSLLKGIDLEVIKERLVDLMEEEKIYSDDELTPQKLAGLLSISQHQLSELLNKHMNSSFYNYISYYRIEEVKHLLQKDTGQSILSIAYATGFNTKSSFYKAFSRLTGMTPLQYQKELLKSK